MADGGDAHTLVRVAVFGLTMSILATALFAVFASGNPDYDYDTIGAYKSELVDFSGGQLVNDTPWVLSGVYTPFNPSGVAESDIPNHVEYDNGRGGWLYGEKITDYPGLGTATDIKLDKTKKSNQLLTVGTPESWRFEEGREWWAGNNPYGIDLSPVGKWAIQTWHYVTENELYTDTSGYGVILNSGTANNWNYTGYRYTFDPMLPFKAESSTKDGRLSLVWYQTSDDTGLSGALEIYGGSGEDQVLLGHYSAYDIVQAYQNTTGYVQTFDFDFEGTHLNLTIRFNPTVYSSYPSLIAAWNDGAWSMAISSVSAGNFFDVDNSGAFASTAGNMLDTFIAIYTFETPSFEDDPAINTIMWLLVGLPMTIALLCVTARLVGGVFKIF